MVGAFATEDIVQISHYRPAITVVGICDEMIVSLFELLSHDSFLLAVAVVVFRQCHGLSRITF